MKGLTVKQPWAKMIADRDKPIETRSWYEKYRGPLLIHSSKNPPIHPAGMALAIVTLLDVRRMTKEDEKDAKVKYKPKLYAFVLGRVWKLPRPFAMSGALYLYETEDLPNVPHHQIRLVERAYLAGCPNCNDALFSNFGRGSFCIKLGGCEHWYNAKKQPYRLVDIDLLKE